jgi:pyrroloquinoline quinone (PQQ) biosynthesis protein C
MFDLKSTIWLKAHARYDDHHPEEALEIIKAFAADEGEQTRVRRSAINWMSYYTMADKARYEMSYQKSL